MKEQQLANPPKRPAAVCITLRSPLFAFGGEVYLLELPKPRMNELFGLDVGDPFKRAAQLVHRLTGIPEEAIGRHDDMADIEEMVEAVAGFLRSGPKRPPSDDSPQT